MRRRDFLKIGASLPAVSALPQLAIARQERGREDESKNRRTRTRPTLSGVDAFNYVIGTQTVGATYQFTQESVLVETARAIREMGSNILKIAMGRDYQRMMLRPSKAAYPETMQFLLNQGRDAIDNLRIRFPGASVEPPPADPAIRTLTDLARLEPAYREVFGMDFAYYLIWTYAFTPRWWHEGFPADEQQKEYAEMKAFASYLLETYSGTGKSFFIGHWEGDWHLRPDLNVKTDATVTEAALQGMVDWLNTRQRAIDDAIRETPHHGVRLYHYATVNHVTVVSLAGRPSVTTRVLPKTNVDYVSYSTYDSLGDIPKKLPKALDYIESKLPPKAGIVGRRVFIGEYGFPAWRVPEPERDRRSRQVMRVGLEWGCAFVLCWQMYNNEFKNGRENGYWLIDDTGTRQPVYQTHKLFYDRSRQYVTDFHDRKGRLPNSDEFRRFALTLLEDEAG